MAFVLPPPLESATTIQTPHTHTMCPDGAKRGDNHQRVEGVFPEDFYRWDIIRNNAGCEGGAGRHVPSTHAEG